MESLNELIKNTSSRRKTKVHTGKPFVRPAVPFQYESLVFDKIMQEILKEMYWEIGEGISYGRKPH